MLRLGFDEIQIHVDIHQFRRSKVKTILVLLFLVHSEIFEMFKLISPKLSRFYYDSYIYSDK